MQCSVSTSDTKLAVCFDENIKRYVDVNQNDFPGFDRAKGYTQMKKEVYESSRYHEAIHVYHYKKYPKFEQIRHNKGPKRRESAQIDELCALAAELSKANDLMGALSLAGAHMPQYDTAHKIFIDLMYKRISKERQSGSFNPSKLVFDYIQNLNSVDVINQVGREMYDIGIKRLEAFIAE